MKWWCINLPDRTDRRNQSQAVFDRLKISVDFYHPQRHTDPAQGCFESHRHLIRQSYDAGDDMVGIFEDDIQLTSSYHLSIWNQVLNFAETNTDWELIYLGVYPESIMMAPKKTQNPNIYRVQSSATHSYIIHRRLMAKLRNVDYFGLPIDLMYMKLKHNYAVMPSLLSQSNSPSDIGGHVVSNGSVRDWIRQINEMFAIYMGTSLIVFCAVGLIYFIGIYIISGIRPDWFAGSQHWVWLIIGILVLVLLRFTGY